jgi:hypothetical protein
VIVEESAYTKDMINYIGKLIPTLSHKVFVSSGSLALASRSACF